jgi:hypothetical protein
VCSKRDVDVNAASMQNNSRRKKSSTIFQGAKQADAITSYKRIRPMIKE